MPIVKLIVVKQTTRIALYIIGWLSFVLGLIGAFLPVMPTVPFWIFAAFCFSRSSPRLYKWLLTRPKVGPQIQEWEEHGVIRRRVKVYASLSIIIGAVYPLFFGPLTWEFKILFSLIMVAVLSFVWTRPEHLDIRKK
jgi:uncharacterized membrane protein YbaN (DUF454 family)